MNTKTIFGKIRTWWFWNSTFVEGIIVTVIGVAMLLASGLYIFKVLPMPTSDILRGIIGSLRVGGLIFTYLGIAITFEGKQDRDSRKMFSIVKAKE